MKPYDAIAWTLLQASAVTAIVGTRVWHGLRPESDTLPSVNYYELAGFRRGGLESQAYSINCRASTPAGARDLAREVLDTLVGETGTYGRQNGFNIERLTMRSDAGLVPEPTEGVYNAPVDVQIVYGADTVS